MFCPLALTLLVQSLKDSLPESLLELKEELDPSEIDPEVLCEVADPEDSSQIVL